LKENLKRKIEQADIKNVLFLQLSNEIKFNAIKCICNLPINNDWFSILPKMIQLINTEYVASYEA